MILVTGATGHVGGAALALLAARHPCSTLAALARDATRARQTVPHGIDVRLGDYDVRSSLDRALRGVRSVIFVASDGPGRQVTAQHTHFFDAVAESSVEHVVFTSITDIDPESPFYFTPVYRDAEKRLRACGKAWTILRCGLYSDFLVSRFIVPARTSGTIAVPAGGARVAPVTRDDVAAAAAQAVCSVEARGQTHELTGPVAHSFEDIARIASQVFGVSIRYAPPSPSEYLRRAWTELDDPWPHAFSTLFAAISQGRYATPLPGVRELTGRAPQNLAAFMQQSSSYSSSDSRACEVHGLALGL